MCVKPGGAAFAFSGSQFVPQVRTPSLLNEIGGSTHAIKNPLEAVVWFVIALFMYDVPSIFIFHIWC